jgi:hypothetical protein
VPVIEGLADAHTSVIDVDAARAAVQEAARRARQRFLRALAPALCALALALASCGEPEAPSVAGRALSVAERAADCPACSALVAAAPAGAFDHDPHTFRCDVCHDSRTGDVAHPAFRSCASAECHVRAWPRTPVHNIDPAVFVECERCHAPHAWRPVSTLCAGCHAEINGPRGDVRVTLVAGVDAFSHGRHESLGCGACHSSGREHATLSISSRAECQSCHHDPSAGRSCLACHDDENGPHPSEARPVVVNARVSATGVVRERTLAFDHDLHAQVPCARCHEGPASNRAKACVACHATHDRPEANCAACHEPPRAGVHGIDVHERGCAGSACHEPATFERMNVTRSFCLSCHTDLEQHQPGGDCAACHKIEIGSGWPAR